MAQRKRIRLGTMRLRIQSRASLSGLRIQWCRELWCRPAAVALIRPLAWEPPYAMGAALKKIKKKKKNSYNSIAREKYNSKCVEELNRHFPKEDIHIFNKI